MNLSTPKMLMYSLLSTIIAAMVVASKDKELARSAQQLLASRYLRINTSR
jgi:glycerol-3-phosphate dehydrogenase